MTPTDRLYYGEMLKRGRLIPFFKGDRLVCAITFFITNDIEKYVQAYSWDALEDNPDGKIAYISQLITDKNSGNAKLSYEIWGRFKLYTKVNFPSVKQICWRRWDKINQVVRTYKKEI